jgi:hypothetical protein
MKPIYTHDCDKCKFLGSMVIPIRDEMADVYMSCGSSEMPAVIFRWSDDPPDYSHVITQIMERYFNPKYFPKD